MTGFASKRAEGCAVAVAVILVALAVAARPPEQPPRNGSPGVIDTIVLDSAVRAEMRALHVPGAAMAVISGDSVVFARGYGVNSIERQDSVTPSTLFRIGSVTKLFTGLAVLSSSEQGRMQLDAPISLLAPSLSRPIGRLTLRQLLTHTAGLIAEPSGDGPHDDDALARRVSRWGAEHTFAPAGDVYSYTSAGYWLAGYALERSQHAHYADVIRTRVLDPLGMQRSTFRPTTAMTWPLALDHRLEGGVARVMRPYADDASTWPAGSLFSSVSELARLARALVNDGMIGGVRALPASAVRAVSTGKVDVPSVEGARCEYSYGLSVCQRDGRTVLSHYGFRIGSGAVFTVVPSLKFGIVVLANRNGAIMRGTEQVALEQVLGASAEAPARQSSSGAPAREQLTGAYAAGADTICLHQAGEVLNYRYGTGAEQRARLNIDGSVSVLDSAGEEDQRFVRLGGRSGALYLHDGLNAWRLLPRTIPGCRSKQ